MADQADPVADYLRTVPGSDRMRAAAWDAAYATDDADAENRLRQLQVSDDVKATLWDLRAKTHQASPIEDKSLRVLGHEVTFLPDGLRDAIVSWGQAGPSRVHAGFSELGQGEFAKGAHDIIGGAGMTALPMVALHMAPAAVSAPLATAGTVAAATGGAMFGDVVLKKVAEAVGATDDQAALAGDIGAIFGGAGGVKAKNAVAQWMSGANGPDIQALLARAAKLPRTQAYRTTYNGLKSLGAPDFVARPVAAIAGSVSDRAAGTAAVGAEATPTASTAPAPAAAPVEAPPASPPPATPTAPRTTAAASPAAPTPQPRVKQLPGETLTVPAAQRTQGQMSPQAILNDLGLANRRMQANLTPESVAQAAQLVTGEGLSPAQAIARVAQMPTAHPASAPKPSPRLRVTQDEAREYARLLSMGKTDQEATEAIVAMRQFRAKTGSTAPSKAARRVKARQTTGRWPEGTP